jgi:hypothetical protein
VAKAVLKNVRLFTGGCDLTGRSNKLELSAEVEAKEANNFIPDDSQDTAWKDMLAGIASAKLSGEGQWEAGDPSMVDDALWLQQGGIGPWTACPAKSLAGNVAWIANAMQGQYQLLGAVGDVAPWKAEASSTWPLVRGLVAHPPGTARTATGSGTAVQHIAVPAGMQLYAALHVLSVAGTGTPTLTVRLQSDDAAGFASPTTRITFTAATAVGAQIQRVAGPVTDTYYRADWTISGTTPSFLFVVAFGVSV